MRRTLDSNQKVIIKRNPSDLSLIHVYDERHNKYLPVPAVDQDYTRGLTLYQHTVISRYVRNELKQKVDLLSLARAKREVQEIVEREWSALKAKSRTRKRLARYRGEGIQKRDGIVGVDNGDSQPLAARAIKPAKPTLLLPPADVRSNERSSDIGTEWPPCETTDEQKPTNLKLVRQDEACKISARLSKNHRKSKRAVKEKLQPKASEDPKTSNAAAKPPKRSKTKSDDDLDMTGWSGHYNLPK